MSRLLAAAALAAAVSACGRPEPAPPAPPPPSAPAARDVVLFVGDSLTAGYGLAAEEAYPALLDARWRAAGLPRRARNAGVSGATSAGVLESLDWSLAPDVAVVVVAVGANDGLRGLPVDALERNVDAVVAKAQAAGARAVLAGMKLPPNYGRDYVARFEAVFPRVAKKRGVPLIPFLLEGVAGRAELNQADGIHPTAAGQRVLADSVERGLREAGVL